MKAADFAALCTILIQEGEMRLIELAEKFVPFYFVEALIFRTEVDPHDPGLPVRFSRLHGCRSSVPVCRPFPDDVVIRCGETLAQQFLRSSLNPSGSVGVFAKNRGRFTFVLIATFSELLLHLHLLLKRSPTASQ